jgi:hypothetical protein
MRMRQHLLAASLALASSALLAQAVPRDSRLHANGLGRLKIGMSLSQVNHLLSRKITPTPVALRADPRCDYQALPQAPGVAVVFIDGRLERIDISSADFADENGIKIGDALNEVAGKLPASKREPLDFMPEGTSMVIERSDHANGLSYQFEGRSLTRMIAGDKKVMRYAEGCG